MLAVKDISFAYGKRRVLESISFNVEPGEIVVLTGSNGGGKTTLLRILANLLVQDKGWFSLDQVAPLQRPMRYRRWIGYLSETAPLYDEMRVGEYLSFRARLKGERTLRIRRRVSEALALCDLESERNRRIRNLSFGMRKRVALAEATCLRPKLLLLDDLLSGLDLEQRRKMADFVTTLSSRTALLLAGHELSEMLPWCTRVMVMEQGQITGEWHTEGHNYDKLLQEIGKAVAGSRGGEL